MKSTSRSLFLLCLTGFCTLATSSRTLTRRSISNRSTFIKQTLKPFAACCLTLLCMIGLSATNALGQVGTNPVTVTVKAPSTASAATLLNVPVTVASNTNGGAMPTGTLTLSSPSYNSPTETLVNGAYTFLIPANSLPLGSVTLTATYSGDANYVSTTGTASVTVVVTGPVNTYVFPKYQILGVVYAPPGAQSNVTYGSSDMVGTSNSVSSNTQINGGVAVTVGADVTIGFLASVNIGFGDTVSVGWTQESGSGSSLSVQTENDNSVSTPGPVSSTLGVNHDNDIIYILLNPVEGFSAGITTSAVTWEGLGYNSCDMTDTQFQGNIFQAVSGCDPNQYPFPDIVGIPVWCLKNPYYPAPSCSQWLPYTSRSWDNNPWPYDATTGLPRGPMLTLQDYADILSADPFVTQTLVPENSVGNFYCHQNSTNMYSYGVNLDPNDAESNLATPTQLTPTSTPSINTITPDECSSAGGTYSCAITSSTACTTLGGTISTTTGLCNITSSTACSNDKGIYSTVTGICTLPPSVCDNSTYAGMATCTWPKNFCSPATQPPATAPTTVTMQRFTPYDTVQYPEPGINGEPQTYQGSVKYTTTSGISTNATSVSTISNTFCMSIGSGSCPGVDTGSVSVPDNGSSSDDDDDDARTRNGSGTRFTTGALKTKTMAVGATGTSLSTTIGAQWTTQQSSTQTNADSSSASYTIVGPQLSDNYTGPTTFNVYEDNVYGTFAFYSDLQREQPPIQLSAPPSSSYILGTNGLAVNTSTGVSQPPITLINLTNCTPSATVTCPAISTVSFGSYGACAPSPGVTSPGPTVTCPVTQTSAPNLQKLRIINNSPYPMTMTGSAITFSDPGFQIASVGQNGSMPDGTPADECSNRSLAAFGTCDIWVQFSPVTSDAPNNEVQSSYPIYANLIAAGTENISGYQNILVTSTGVTASGTAMPGSSMLGASLLPGTSTVFVAGASNQYSFPTGTVSEPFTFYNLSSLPMTITSIVLSDGVDFTVGSGTCIVSTANPLPPNPNGSSTLVNGNGYPVPASQSCNFVLNFTGKQSNVLLNTGITVNGTMNGLTAPGPLAGAGATATLLGIAVSPLVERVGGTYTETCTTTSACGPTVSDCPSSGANNWDGSRPSAEFTVTNYTLGNVTLNYACYNSQNQAVSSLGSGSSCTISIPELQTGCNTAPSYFTRTFGGCSTTVTTWSCSDNYTDGATIQATAASGPLPAVSVSMNVTNVTISDNELYESSSTTSVKSAVVKITGAEQSAKVDLPATAATASLTLNSVSTSSSARVATTEAARRESSGAPSLRTPARMLPVKPEFVQSTLSVGVGGFTKALNVPAGTAVNDAAAQLAAQLNAAGSPVTAAANGSVVNLTSVATGSAANLPLSAFVIGEYKVTPSSNTLTGGKAGGTTTNYDSGTVQVTTNGVTASAQWGSGSTQESVAAALAASINQVAGAYWSATASGNVVNLTPVSSASTASTQATPAKARTTARRSPRAAVQTEATAAKPDASTTPASSSISVSVIDAAGFSTPSFTATTN